MTDIYQHLPIILAQIQRSLAESTAAATLLARLRADLPLSYGLATQCGVSENAHHTPPFELVIYDTTLPTEQDTLPDSLTIQRVLAVIKLAGIVTQVDLLASLQQIAQMRLLRSTGSLAKKKRSLPLGIVALQSLGDVRATGPEQLALTLDGLLHTQPEALRPDYLLAQAYQLTFQHPRVSKQAVTPTTINIQREPRLKKPRSCYVCKQTYKYAHFFYEYLCLPCGDLNYRKRALPLDLTGRTALVTGGRVKIGYATALRLLQAGVQVLITTRFPHDAARRYSSEPDFAVWRERLHIYGLDFRYLPVLERFVEHLQTTYGSLDILINNAAQTVRYPPEHYAALLPLEHVPLTSLPEAQQALVQQSHALLPPPQVAHEAALALTHQLPAPTNERNSWTLALDEVSLTEFLEVQIINVTAPWLLSSGLRPLLRHSPFPQRFIINVSAVEGRFASAKQGTHVHTNMAKASLNMLTHSAASDLARDNIFINSVDPGWISQQAPSTNPEYAERVQQLIPLDLLDAAARICDPIFTGIASNAPTAGKFYKDYLPVSW